MKQIYILCIILLIMSLLLNSCSEKKCSGFNIGPSGEVFSFRLVDENTNETLIGAWGTKYDHEDLEFKQAFKDNVRGLEIRGNGRITFHLVDHIHNGNEDDIVNKPFLNTYYLYLDSKNENRQTDIDTIVVSCEIIRVDGKCESLDYGMLSVTYNDSLYHQGEFKNRIDFVKK